MSTTEQGPACNMESMATLGVSLAISIPSSMRKPKLIAGGKEKAMLTCWIVKLFGL